MSITKKSDVSITVIYHAISLAVTRHLPLTDMGGIKLTTLVVIQCRY